LQPSPLVLLLLQLLLSPPQLTLPSTLLRPTSEQSPLLPLLPLPSVLLCAPSTRDAAAAAAAPAVAAASPLPLLLTPPQLQPPLPSVLLLLLLLLFAPHLTRLGWLSLVSQYTSLARAACTAQHSTAQHTAQGTLQHSTAQRM
jgi:hypothetical protein